MPLSIQEQLNVTTGVIIPNDSSYNITTLTEQVAINFAQDFFTNAKTISGNTESDILALTYRSKIVSTSNTLIRGRQNISILAKIIIAIYADTGEYSTITNATTAQWSTFIENNITQAIEIVSSVLPEEKTAYNAI